MGGLSVAALLALLYTPAAAESPTQVVDLQLAGAPLPRAPVVRSFAGELSTALALGATALVGEGVSVVTRAFNGSIPGPTLAVYPGDTLSIRFSNELSFPSGHDATNAYHHPNTTNLHVHGLHVSPNSPGDDVLGVKIEPGGSNQYRYRLLPDHSPGTYWVHPHHHGSQVLQTGAGAASALLVLDPPGFLSPQLEALEDQVLLLQDLNAPLLGQAAAKSGDHMLHSPSWSSLQVGSDLLLVNGARQPVVSSQAGVWQRLRLVMAGPSAWLHLAFGECEVALLAKDGIYISDFPREVQHVALPPGGRADVVVRCPASAAGQQADHVVTAAPKPGTTGVKVLVGPVFVIRAAPVRTSAGMAAASVALAAEPLMAWSPPRRPSYLADLRSWATPDCSCSTSMGLGGNTRAFNGHVFGGATSYMHHSPRDAVVERLIVGVDKHTYHQHTWPFQLQRAPAGDDPYWRAGDWHDSYLNTLDDKVLVRWRSVDYDGPVVVHCHALAHSDQGMIAVELVGGAGPEQCACDLLNSPAAVEVPLGGAHGLALAAGAVLVFSAVLVLSLGTGATFVRALVGLRDEREAAKAKSYETLSAGPAAA